MLKVLKLDSYSLVLYSARTKTHDFYSNFSYIRVVSYRIDFYNNFSKISLLSTSHCKIYSAGDFSDLSERGIFGFYSKCTDGFRSLVSRLFWLPLNTYIYINTFTLFGFAFVTVLVLCPGTLFVSLLGIVISRLFKPFYSRGCGAVSGVEFFVSPILVGGR